MPTCAYRIPKRGVTFRSSSPDMYTTRRLSTMNTIPETAATLPPEGPGSGVLLTLDEAYESESMTCCFGICPDPYFYEAPFPQDRRLVIEYTTTRSSGTNGGTRTHTSRNAVYLVPAIDQPLSSNRYYVVIAEGKHKGKVSTSSTEEDMTNCFCCGIVNDLKPTEFGQSGDVHQQVEILPYNTALFGRSRGDFYAKAVDGQGYPQNFLRRKGWRIRVSGSRPNFHLGEASGVDTALRARLPDMSFAGGDAAWSSPSVVIGKWYCPFLFVREECKVKEQLKSSMFYEMRLEQFWEKIYECENQGNGDLAYVNVSIRTERPLYRGRESVREDTLAAMDGVRWFRPVKSEGDGVGLGKVILERMRWEQERGGWVEGKEEVDRVEEYDGKKGWSKFRCYVLVERFALRRTDRSLLLTYDFKHTNKVRCLWE